MDYDTKYKRFIVCEWSTHEYFNQFTNSADTLEKAILLGNKSISKHLDCGFWIFDCQKRKFVYES